MQTYQIIQARAIVGMAAEMITTPKIAMMKVVEIDLRLAAIMTKKVEYQIKEYLFPILVL